MGSSKPNLLAIEKANLKTYADSIEEYYTPFLFSNTIIRLKKATKMTNSDLEHNTGLNIWKIKRILRYGAENNSVIIEPRDVCLLACAFGLNKEDLKNLLTIAFPETYITQELLGKPAAASTLQQWTIEHKA